MTAHSHDNDSEHHWRPGDQVLLRYRRNQPADVVVPVTVVEDTETHVALFTAVETPIKLRFTPDGALQDRAILFVERERMPVILGDVAWHSSNVLWLSEPGRARSIGLFWDATDGRFRGYYVDLQAPLRRTRLGFDTADYLLDIEIDPDLTWRWKDEDEFAFAQDLGIFTAEHAVAIRAEGERAIADVEARRWPFNAGYDSWRPDPSWPVPTMPADWDRD